ncbi:glycosyltransferase family 4 protein [Horticoccus sp. 23ND18S-11]|uniref:glycosyltransferase family 4 protein n=1 Tax=Horticoccus sp. 23ND18S-11 TaxID=3391832 RepID=UPI0039C8E34F
MRILFISPSWPGGTAFGGQIRATHIARALQQIGSVSVLMVSEDWNEPESRKKCAEEFRVLPPVCPKPSLNRGLDTRLRRAFDPRFLDLHGMCIEEADRERILTESRRHDFTWIIHSRTPSIIGEWNWPKTHLDIDDIPSTYLQTVSSTSRSKTTRLKTAFQAKLMKRRELTWVHRFTTLSVCSEPDRTYLGKPETLHVIPNGFTKPQSQPVRSPTRNPFRIGFIGLFSYTPNREGVQWFIRECWSAIRASCPNVRLRLVGRGSDVADYAATPGVEPLGWIADPESEISTWSAMVIPIRSGGGTRIKIAEAFSRRCPVVSTSVGAYGYQVTTGEELLIADTPNNFAQACISLLSGESLGNKVAENAWQRFVRDWTWEAIAPKVIAAGEDCMRRAAGGRTQA